jgi:hypothetical protein
VAVLVRAVLESYLGIYAAIAPTRPLGDRTGIACRKGYAVSQQTTFETSQTDTHGVGSARSLRLKSSSQKNPSQYCDTALMRHTFRNECNEANLEPVSDTPTTCPVRFPLQPSCCRTVCTDPYIRLASAYLRDATDRPLPVSHAARDPQVKDTVLLRDCAERTTRRNLVVTVTKLRHMPPRTVEHRAESDNGQMWRRENWTRR